MWLHAASVVFSLAMLGVVMDGMFRTPIHAGIAIVPRASGVNARGNASRVVVFVGM